MLLKKPVQYILAYVQLPLLLKKYRGERFLSEFFERRGACTRPKYIPPSSWLEPPMAKTRGEGSIHMTAYSTHMAQSNLHVLTERKRSSLRIEIKWKKLNLHLKFGICISVEKK